MAALQTVMRRGLVASLAILGMWRLSSLFPTARARVAALVVYAAVPLPGELFADRSLGRVDVLRGDAVDGALAAPLGGNRVGWVVQHGRRCRARAHRRVRRRARWCDGSRNSSLVTAVTFAFAPSFAVVLVGVGATLALATLLIGGEGGHVRAAATLAFASVGAVVVAVVANLPWSASLTGSNGWTAIVGVPAASARALGIGELARFLNEDGGLDVLSLFVFLPVVAAPLIARAWRFAWAARAVALVAGFGALLVLDDRNQAAVAYARAGCAAWRQWPSVLRWPPRSRWQRCAKTC